MTAVECDELADVETRVRNKFLFISESREPLRVPRHDNDWRDHVTCQYQTARFDSIELRVSRKRQHRSSVDRLDSR